MYTLRLSAANSQITLSEFTSSSSILSFLFPSPLCNVHKVNDLDSSPTLPENIKKMFEDIAILAGWSMNILPLIPPQWLFQSVLFYPEKEICPQARFCSSFSLTLHSCLVWIRAVQLSLSPSSLVVSISYVLSSHAELRHALWMSHPSAARPQLSLPHNAVISTSSFTPVQNVSETLNVSYLYFTLL